MDAVLPSRVPGRHPHARRWRPLSQFDFVPWGHPFVIAVLAKPAIDAADRPLIDLPVVDAKRPPGRYCLTESDRLAVFSQDACIGTSSISIFSSGKSSASPG